MGLGTVVGILFFTLVLFAAVTSSIALTESAVSTFEDELGWDRKQATVLIGHGFTSRTQEILLLLPDERYHLITAFDKFLPVSYTHLDVYKRQSFCISFAGLSCSTGLLPYFSKYSSAQERLSLIHI